MKQETDSIYDIFDIFNICLFSGFSVLTGYGNICIDPIGTDGEYRGYSPNFGAIQQPEYKQFVYYDCLEEIDCSIEIPCYNMVRPIHTLMWNSDGHFILKIGANGDEKFNDKDSIYVDGNEATWNSTEQYYEFTNKNLADSLIPLTEHCFKVSL